jgi:PIN domain nuclease of toxin-antitoxin system
VAPTVLDASAVIAALANEPARPQVEALLRAETPPVISAVNLAEAIEWLVRLGGHSPQRVRETVNWLIVGGLQVEPVWPPLARSAAALRARHYHRTDRPISLADCFCLTTAISLAANLATTDSHLAGLAGDLGVEVIALPDSTGAPTRRRG